MHQQVEGWPIVCHTTCFLPNRAVQVVGQQHTWPRTTSSRLRPRKSRPTLSPAWPSLRVFLNISTPARHCPQSLRSDISPLGIPGVWMVCSLQTVLQQLNTTKPESNLSLKLEPDGGEHASIINLRLVC